MKRKLEGLGTVFIVALILIPIASAWSSWLSLPSLSFTPDPQILQDRMLEVEKLLNQLKTMMENANQALNKRVDKVVQDAVNIKQGLNDRVDKVVQDAEVTNQALNNRVDKVVQDAGVTNQALNDFVDKVEKDAVNIKQTVKERVEQVEKEAGNIGQVLQRRVDKMEQVAEERKVWFAAGGGSTKRNGIIIFENVYVNAGSKFDPNTGVFTAPFKGAYLCSLDYAYAGGTIHLELERKNVNGMTIRPTYVHQSGWFFSNRMIYLEVGDTLYARAYEDHTFISSPYNVFGCFLVGRSHP